MIRHLLDLPDDIDQVRLLCGPCLDEVSRRHRVSGDVALTTCIACLRAHAAKQHGEIVRLTQAVERLQAKAGPDP